MKKLLLLFTILLLTSCSYPMGADLVVEKVTREDKIASIKDKVKIGKKEKEIAYTDENDGETFIIKTDKKDYVSMGGDVMAHFSITNVSENNQDAYIVFSLGDKQFVRSIEVFERNDISYETIQATSSEQIITHEVDIWSDIPFDTFDVSKTKIIRKDTKDRDIDKIFKGNFNVGETKYYRAVMRIPYGITENEWFIEAFGDLNAYSHLDPNNWTLEDKFNSDTKSTGDLNGQDSWSGSAVFDVVTSGSPASYEGDQLVEDLSSADAYTIDNATINGIVSGTYCISMMAHITTGSFPKVYLYNNNSLTEVLLKFDNSGNIEVLDGAAWVSVGSTYSADTWVRYCLAFECGSGAWEGLVAETFKVDVEEAGWTTAYDFERTGGTSMSKITFSGYAGGGDENYWDYLSYEYGGAAPTPAASTNQQDVSWFK